MKKIKFWLIFGVSFLFLLSFWVATPKSFAASFTGSQKMSAIFPDIAVRRAVNRALGKNINSDDSVTQTMLNNISGTPPTVYIDPTEQASFGIASNLQGIQYLNNIEKISFQNANISSLAPLAEANMPKLKQVYLKDNPLTQQALNDFGKGTFPVLEELYVEENKATGFTDLSPLVKFTTLKKLSLIKDNINDANMQYIAKLVNLNELWLNTNNIYNVDPLKTLTKLTTFQFSQNHITTLFPIGSLPIFINGGWIGTGQTITGAPQKYSLLRTLRVQSIGRTFTNAITKIRLPASNVGQDNTSIDAADNTIAIWDWQIKAPSEVIPRYSWDNYPFGGIVDFSLIPLEQKKLTVNNYVYGAPLGQSKPNFSYNMQTVDEKGNLLEPKRLNPVLDTSGNFSLTNQGQIIVPTVFDQTLTPSVGGGFVTKVTQINGYKTEYQLDGGLWQTYSPSNPPTLSNVQTDHILNFRHVYQYPQAPFKLEVTDISNYPTSDGFDFVLSFKIPAGMELPSTTINGIVSNGQVVAIALDGTSIQLTMKEFETLSIENLPVGTTFTITQKYETSYLTSGPKPPNATDNQITFPPEIKGDYTVADHS